MRFWHTILALAAPFAAAQHTIHGTVADIQGVPISGVTVTLTTETSAGRRITTTSDSGEYSFPDVRPGGFQLIFSRAGYETVTHTGKLSSTGEGAQVSVTLPVAGEVTSIEVTDVAGKATGSRLDIPNRDIPVQISVIPQALLQQQAVNSVVDALKNASGVQAFRWYGVYEYYTIRGFNQADVMLMDGMRLEGNRFNTQTNNIESLEVLKGPSSVLYGGGAVGGVINIVRKKPQGTRAYDFLYRGGSFNTHQIAGGATGPVGALDRVLYRADLSYEHSDGWRKAGADRFNASPTLTWLMSERARVTVHQAFNRDRFDGDGGVPLNMTTHPLYRRDWRFNLPQDNALVEDSQTHILLNANVSNSWEFRDGFLMRRTSDRYFVTEGVFGVPAQNLVNREALDFHHTRRPVQNQADLIGRFRWLGMHHTVLAGYEYQDYYSRTDVTAGNDPTCNCGYWINLPPINVTNFIEPGANLDTKTVFRKTYFANQIHAGYWQDQISVLPNLKINVAGRLDDYDRRVHRIFTNNPGVRTFIQRRNQSAYTYRAGIVYTPFGAHQFYFNTSTSFTPVTVVPANQQELNPQRGRLYEIGYRSKAWNNRLDWNIAAYTIERDNNRVAQTPTTVLQVGALRSQGVDVDVNHFLGWGTRLIGAWGFAQARIDDPGSSLHNRFPRFVPRHTANAWLRKDWRSGWGAALGARYVGKQFVNDSNATRIGGYTTLSGAVNYRRERWEWALNVENLLNRERYFLPGHFANLIFPGAPINASTSLRWRFN
jgi:iron complex outermembrane receptor protein